MESTLEELTLSETGECFQEDAPLFYPTYCVEFCPCAKACFLKLLHESCCHTSKLSQPQLCPLPFAIRLHWAWDFFRRKLRADFSAGSHARGGGDCRSLVLPCSEDLYGADKVQEKGGRSDPISPSSSRAGYCSAWGIRSLSARCQFSARSGPGDTKTPLSLLSVNSVWGEGQRGKGVTSFVYFQAILRNIFRSFF